MTNFDQMSDDELQAMIQRLANPPPTPPIPPYTPQGPTPGYPPSPHQQPPYQQPPPSQMYQQPPPPNAYNPPPQPPLPQYAATPSPQMYQQPQQPPPQPQYVPNPVSAPMPPTQQYGGPPLTQYGGAGQQQPQPQYAQNNNVRVNGESVPMADPQRSPAGPVTPQSSAHLAAMEKAKSAKAVDVCFVVDCTGSMTHWIQQVKDKVLAIVRGVKGHPRVKEVRLGFIGYRDYFYPTDQRYVVVPFTEDEGQFEQQVRGVQALYCDGNDEPEDLLGGLDQALRLDWKSKTRIIILITDAPCHGQEYHTLEESSHNVNYHDPFKPETLLRAMGTRFNIDLTFCRIKTDTDLMISKFKPMYEDRRGSGRGLKQIELSTNVDDFLPKMVQTITESVNKANK